MNHCCIQYFAGTIKPLQDSILFKRMNYNLVMECSFNCLGTDQDLLKIRPGLTISLWYLQHYWRHFPNLPRLFQLPLDARVKLLPLSIAKAWKYHPKLCQGAETLNDPFNQTKIEPWKPIGGKYGITTRYIYSILVEYRVLIWDIDTFLIWIPNEGISFAGPW